MERKHFRYTFVSRLQNLALSVIENLYRANDNFAKKGDIASIDILHTCGNR